MPSKARLLFRSLRHPQFLAKSRSPGRSPHPRWATDVRACLLMRQHFLQADSKLKCFCFRKPHVLFLNRLSAVHCFGPFECPQIKLGSFAALEIDPEFIYIVKFKKNYKFCLSQLFILIQYDFILIVNTQIRCYFSLLRL